MSNPRTKTNDVSWTDGASASNYGTTPYDGGLTYLSWRILIIQEGSIWSDENVIGDNCILADCDVLHYATVFSDLSVHADVGFLSDSCAVSDGDSFLDGGRVGTTQPV